MMKPGKKPRWSAEKRNAKGANPSRRGGHRDAVDADRPLNRKQRRALEFGDRPYQGADNDRKADRPRDDRPRDDRPRDDRPRHGDDQRASRRYPSDDRGGYRRDDRPRDDRGGDRRDFRRDDRFEDRRRDDRGGFRRDDRFEDRRRDDRRDDRGGYRRDDRFEDRRRDDRPDDRGGYRRDDRPKLRAGGSKFEPRRDHEPRGHVDKRRHFDRDRDRGFDRDRNGDRGFDRAPRDEFDAESDQMSWTATTAEAVEGDVASGFFELGVAEPLVRVLAGQGITAPFPIQAATIGDALAGRDVLGRGRTGSGKTLAFGLPMLTRLAEGRPVGSPRAMILTPTRELALQIADNLSPLAAAVGIDLTLVAGGMSYGPQIKAFERGVDVVVATPGRLIDLLEQGVADLSQVEIAVLDEADHMADLGFLTPVQTLLDASGDGQRLLFSATLDNAVASLVRTYLHDAVTHEVDSSKASVSTMVHRPLLVHPHHKNQVTAEIANRDGRTVLFARTQLGTDRIAGQLREAGVMAGSLHGGLTQGARARILTAFREGTVPVLVATDVAARGIHVDDVTLVLQVDPPHDSKDYLHRAGRTARAGNEGIVASIVLPHQRKMSRRLLGQAGVPVEAMPVEPSSDELFVATGARPTSGEPIADAEYQALIAPKQQQRRRPDGPRGGRGGHGGRGGYGGQRGRQRRDRY
jgi:superfamily II DNA/RNA helicase